MFGKLAEKIFPLVQKTYWRICFRGSNTEGIMKQHEREVGTSFTDMTFQGEDFKDMHLFGKRLTAGHKAVNFDFKLLMLKRYTGALPFFFKLIPFANDDNLHDRIKHPDALFWLDFKNTFLQRLERSNGFIRNFQGAMNTIDSEKYPDWENWDTPEFREFVEGLFNSMALIAEADCYYRIQGTNAVLLFYAMALDCQKRLDDNCSKCEHTGDGHLVKMIQERQKGDTEALKNFANYLLGEDVVEEVQPVPGAPNQSYGVRIKKKAAA